MGDVSDGISAAGDAPLSLAWPCDQTKGELTS